MLQAGGVVGEIAHELDERELRFGAVCAPWFVAVDGRHAVKLLDKLVFVKLVDTQEGSGTISTLPPMGALTESRRARRAIAAHGYATPVAYHHLVSPGASMAWGAWSMIDPFRSSLPYLYSWNWDRAIADAMALRSDWSMYGEDFVFVVGDAARALGAESTPRVHPDQRSLFDDDAS